MDNGRERHDTSTYLNQHSPAAPHILHARIPGEKERHFHLGDMARSASGICLGFDLAVTMGMAGKQDGKLGRGVFCFETRNDRATRA